MTNTFRFVFESTNLTTDAPIAISYNERPKDKPSSIYHNDNLHYAIYGSNPRGAIRNHCSKEIFNRLRKFDRDFKIDSKTARFWVIGGVKDSGESATITPEQHVRIRKEFPFLDVFGAGDPIFFASTLFMGIMVSEHPIPLNGKGEVNPMTIIPIMRRPMISNTTFDPSEISDPEQFQLYADWNSRRSKIENAVDDWGKLEWKGTKAALTSHEQRRIQEIRDRLTAEAGKPISNVDLAKEFLEEFKAEMTKAGLKKQSEANLQKVATIPSGTCFNHRMELCHSSQLAVGLFLAGLHNRYLFSPKFGGLVARGAGGTATGEYSVRSQDIEGVWQDDCVLRVIRDRGIEIDGVNSKLMDALRAWREVDVRKYRFNFDELTKIIQNKDNN